MPTFQNDNFTILAPRPIDSRWGKLVNGVQVPYASVAEALATVTDHRYRNLTLPVIFEGEETEFWFKGGITDNHFVQKITTPEAPAPTTPTGSYTESNTKADVTDVTTKRFHMVRADESKLDGGGLAQNTLYICTGTELRLVAILGPSLEPGEEPPITELSQFLLDFKNRVIADGGTTIADEDIIDYYNALPAQLRDNTDDSTIVFVPIGWKVGKVYDLRGNDLTFARTQASSATYINKAGVLVYAAANEPRLTYDPVTGTFLGLLMESKIQNRMFNSENFNVWTQPNITITANTTNGPDNNPTADIISATAAGGKVSMTIGNSGPCSYSVFAKPIASNFAILTCGDGTNSVSQGYNLTTGALVGSAVITGTGYSLISASTVLINTFYRLKFIVSNTTANENPTFSIMPSQDGIAASANGNSIVVWGAQCEFGPLVTSYFKKDSNETERGFDQATLASAPGWYDQVTGSMFFSGSIRKHFNENASSIVQNGSQGKFLYDSAAQTNDATLTLAATGYDGIYIGKTGIVPETQVRYAMAWGGGTKQTVVDGTAQTSTAHGGQWDIGALLIGASGNNRAYFTLTALAWWKRKLTQGEMIALTTP